MEGHVGIPYLREVAIFLIASAIIVPLFHRLRFSPVLGYLIVGGLVGPFGLGLLANDTPWISYIVIADIEGIRPLAELGVIFLLFIIGIELSFKRLWAMRRLVFGLGSLQVLTTALAITALAWAWGNSLHASITLGACLALSSTAIVMQLLFEGRRLATPLGQSSFAILLFQDLAVVPILIMLGVFGSQIAGEATTGSGSAMLAILRATAVIGIIVIVGRLALRPLFRLASSTKSPGIFVAASLLVVITAAALTGKAGLSMALGAFVAGLLLAGSEFRHQIETDIEPFKGLLLGLFFMTVGMGIDYRLIALEPFWITASVMGLFALKTTIIIGLCFAFRLPRHVAIEAGLLLGQGGEFAFVVLGLATTLGVVPPATGQFMLIVVGLSMLVTPLVAMAGTRIGTALRVDDNTRRHAREFDALGDMESHIIIAGFGRVGQMLGRILDREGLPYVAIDVDGPAVGRWRSANLPVFYGDAAQIELLKRTGIERASALVITLDNYATAEILVRSVRRHLPAISIFARARDTAHARWLLKVGATAVVPETIEATLQLSQQVLLCVGSSEEAALRHVERERQTEMERLQS